MPEIITLFVGWVNVSKHGGSMYQKGGSTYQ